ncbi:flagellar export protein FliJ [Rhodospira trueperi]|uniref:Flagellar FliJ protein n=1 Tax=Rhodospira trueperi TaxID=69960 RepID=A0A1G7G365_9PROT|nr:flagellar export protein FliJ [Rhodospira trueperi]SDE82537.1 FliJ protein [Rhodospira trueperi]
MAKGDLHAVIRLNKLEIDELRRQIGVLLREESDLVARDRALDEALARESRLADKHPEAAYTFPAFLTAHRQRKADLAEALADVRARIETTRESLAELYRRRKTYELAQDARDKRAEQERARKDQAVLDEVGLTMHRRRRAEDGEDGIGDE